MHFPDLTPCTYGDRGAFHDASWAAPLLAVGWLERPHRYPSGARPRDLVPRLHSLAAMSRARFREYEYRGLHVCSWCPPVVRQPLQGSNVTLLVPGDGVVYATPAAVIHHMTSHLYCPPQPFIDAVATCPTDPSAYLAALRRANLDQDPPYRQDRPRRP